MMKKLSCLFVLFLIQPMLLAQQHLDTLDDELPMAPLREDDAGAKPPPRPAKPAPVPVSAPPIPDVAKVVAEKCVKPKGKFAWNQDKAKLSSLVEQISRLTCRNFIISGGVRPTQEISIISRTPITVDQAWQAFQSTLEANELSLFKTGDYYKIIKRSESPRQPISVVDEKNALPQDESMVTFLYDVKHLPKDVAQSLVKGMISRSGDLLVIGETFLVITDGSSNIKRIMNILEKVDIVGATNRIRIVDLIHADAVQIQTKLNDIFASLGGKSAIKPASRSPYDDYRMGGGGAEDFSVQKMIAEERTNKLIIIASDKAFDRIKEMIDVLDVPTSGAGTQSQIYVYYLKNGDSKKIATSLSTLVQGMKSSSNANKSPGVSNFRGGPDSLFEGDIKVTADEATNALLIAASPRDYKAMIQVIAKLDKKRTQVYVEAAILEINIEDSGHVNLGAFGGIPLPGGNTMIVSNPAGKSLAENMFKSIAGAQGSGNPQTTAALGLAPFLNTLGFLGASQKLTLNGFPVDVPGVGAILDILQTYSNADILATPSLMTLDNEKAEMSVGERVPTISGASAAGLLGGAGGAAANLGSLLSQVKYEEPKLKFTITPHVNDDNHVRLEIKQDVMNISSYIPLNNSQYPTFTTKTAETTVSSHDQQTIVLGGMINESYQTSESKVPFLGDIPLLGYFFKSSTKKKIKKNLMLILTPYVVRNENDLRRIYERKNKEREEFGKLYFGDKITTFDPYIDYDKKTGPLSHMMEQIQFEMKKTENGGVGLPGESLFKAPTHTDQDQHKIQILEIPSATILNDENQKSSPVPQLPSEVPVTETTVITLPPDLAPQQPAPVASGGIPAP